MFIALAADIKCIRRRYSTVHCMARNTVIPHLTTLFDSKSFVVIRV